MAEKKNKTDKDVFVNYVNVRPINRRSLDIQAWRNAIKAAEAYMRNRVKLLDIYEEVLLDGHLKSLVEKRINAITNIQLRFFDNNQKEDNEINNIINKSYFEKLLQEIIKAKLYGYTLCELDWSTEEGYKNTTHSIDRRHVRKEEGIVVKMPFDSEGVSFTDHPFALFVDTKNHGLLAQAAQYVIYKRNNNADWAEYNEIYGKPYAQGKYNNPDTADLLTEAFEKAGFDAYMVAPDDAEITLHSPSSQSSTTVFKDFRDVINEELSILILGQNLTSKVSEGSYAAGKMHHEVEQSIHDTDREFVIRILNEKLIPVLQNLGYKADGEFKFIDTDDIPLKDRIMIDMQVANLVPVDDDYFYETYNIPRPQNSTNSNNQNQNTNNNQGNKNMSTAGNQQEKTKKAVDIIKERIRDFFFQPEPDFKEVMQNLYTSNCHSCATLAQENDNFFEISKAALKRALQKIYDKNIDLQNEIEPELFEHTRKNLNNAVDDVYGEIQTGDPDYDFVQELKYNNAVFAAFKTHKEQNDLAKLITDNEGNLRSFKDFRKATEPIIGNYNENWLKTEYNTAVLRTREASKFRKYERDADIFPNLKWLPSTSAEKRETHQRFYGLVKQINDGFWDTHYPGNLWNCKCGITNTDEATNEHTPAVNYEPQPGIDRNPKEGKLFTKSHPYHRKGYAKVKKLDNIARKKANEVTKDKNDG